jgi:hypothetical protein
MDSEGPSGDAERANRSAEREYDYRRTRQTEGGSRGRPAMPVCRHLGVAPPPRFGRTKMAKSQKRSGREPKKPKQSKSRATAAASPFTAVHAKPAPTPDPKK